MPTFAQKQNQPQQPSSGNLARSNMVSPVASHAHDVLHLQRTIGSQAVLRLLQARAEGFEARTDIEVNSEIPATTRFAHDFSRIPLHAPTPITIQPKLAINTLGDIYEQEADHVAEQVMRMPESRQQGDCSCGRGCATCQTEQSGQEHQRLQTKHVGSSDAGQIAAPPIVHEVLASPGQPIDSSTRAFFEPRFGHDFSHVRVHTDERAGNSAHAVNALAYTAGRHIVFGAGKYSPTTAPGQRLLAHELAHSVQQGVVPCRLPQRFDDAGNTLERQVDEATNGVVNNFSLPGMSPTISIAPTLQTKLLQRKSEPPPNPEFQDEEPTTTRSSSTSHDTVCLGKYLIETWGQDTCCTRLGFMDNEAVNKKDGTTISSCNKWPLFLALHAKEHGLDGVASCQPSHLGRKAEITVGGKMLTVGCVDTRANDNRVIEIDAEAAQEFFGSKNLREPGHQVCFGEAGSFATCRFETKCNPHPKETACLPVGVTKGGIDSPEKHGWHTE